jgi:hypothetical protein
MNGTWKNYLAAVALGATSFGCTLQTADNGEVAGQLGEPLITNVTVEKVRACKHSIGCGSYVTNPQYHF